MPPAGATTPLGTGDERPHIPQPLEQTRVVAILRRINPETTVEAATALLQGGVRALEVTLNSPGVLDMLRALRHAFGDRMLLGAGTVLDLPSAESALAAGARFIVSPHTDPELIRALARRGVPCIPGAFTATEVLAAWRAGAAVVKVFPVGSVGPAYIKDLLGPLSEIPLLPTGGVTRENAPGFITAGAWGLGLGSALVDPTLCAEGRYDELVQRAKRFVQIAERTRGAE